MKKVFTEEKRRRIKEAIDCALDVYRRHSVFTVAVSKKESEAFECVVFPHSADLPASVNYEGFNFCLMYKSHWQAVPENLLDQMQKYM